ncbi:hypothetical protein [Candidatus Nitrospira bockiana]
MRFTLAFLLGLGMLFVSSIPLPASTGDLTTVIESFVAKQFPTAKSYFWVVNDAQWQTENELVVDLNTIVQTKTGEAPTANRYLLLIVGDHLAASQNIPLDSEVDCQPEQQT